MLENGADIRFLQEMPGHANLQTTQIYTRVSISKLKEVHSATHPGAKHERHRGDEAHQDLAAPGVDKKIEERRSFKRGQIWARPGSARGLTGGDSPRPGIPCEDEEP